MGPYTAHQQVVHLQQHQPHHHQHTAQLHHPQHQQQPIATAAKTEGDVQWIVGWIRDILVIAMSLANLLHVANH